jgi:hypothetical protein
MICKNVFKFLSLLNNPVKVYTCHIRQEGTVKPLSTEFQPK